MGITKGGGANLANRMRLRKWMRERARSRNSKNDGSFVFESHFELSS